MSSTLICNPEELIFENIVTINESALVKNFQLLSQCMNSFKGVTQKISQFQKSTKAIADEVERLRKKQEKDYIEVKSSLRDVQSDSKQLVRRDSNKSTENIEENIRSNLREGLQDALMGHLEKELKLIRTNSQMKANQQTSFEQQIEVLRREVNNLKLTKLDMSEVTSLKQFMKEDSKTVEDLKKKMDELKNEVSVSKTYIIDYQPLINTVKDDLAKSIEQLNQKLKFKSDISDILKVEELLLNMIEHSANMLNKKYADKLQTKKGLVFLEKRINKLIMTMFGDNNQEDKDALLATKGWKCISCTKDLKQYEGRLDKFKPWAVFPTKEISKEKYTGFGVGFQNVVEKAVEKKGVEATYDNYGRMTTPYNLSRQVNIGSNKTTTTPTTQRGLSSSHSTMMKTSRNNTSSPSGPNFLETNFMNHFGSGSEVPINMRSEYKNKFIGMQEYIKFTIDQRNTAT